MHVIDNYELRQMERAGAARMPRRWDNLVACDTCLDTGDPAVRTGEYAGPECTDCPVCRVCSAPLSTHAGWLSGDWHAPHRVLVRLVPHPLGPTQRAYGELYRLCTWYVAPECAPWPRGHFGAWLDTLHQWERVLCELTYAPLWVGTGQ